MVKSTLKMKDNNDRKLAMLLFSDSRTFFWLAGGILLIALSFILFFVSLNSTIVNSKRQQNVETHGRFLGVLSDIDKETASIIMETEKEFCYKLFQIQEEVYCGDKRVFTGWVSEETGKSMGIFLKAGRWPEQENEILLEEYLAYQLGISDFPRNIVLRKDGQEAEYTVCGIIKNYSGNLPVSYRDAEGKKNYPSIITANYEETKPVSLMILQKYFDMATAQEDILTVMSLYEKYHVSSEQVCLNQYLDECYSNTKDFETVSLIYTLAVLFLLLLVEAAIVRAILLKGNPAKGILQEMGLQRKALVRAYAWQFGKLFLSAWALVFLFGVLWGMLGGYVTGYGKLLEKQVWNTMLKLLLTFVVSLLIVGIVIWGYKSEKQEKTEKETHTYRYLFRKVNVPMFLMQSVFLMFLLFSFCMREKFAVREEEIRVSITAQRMHSYRQIGAYAFSEKMSGYFECESIDLFEDDADVLDMYMIAEMQYASIISEKEPMRPYFEQMLAFYTDMDMWQDDAKDVRLSEEAQEHEVLPWDVLQVLVLPDGQYQQLLSDNEIMWEKSLEQIPECVVHFPISEIEESFKREDNHSLITIGRVILQEDELLLEKENFRILGRIENITGLEKLIMRKTLCVLVLPVSEAKKSELISGYSEMEFQIKATATKEQQGDIDNKIAMLAASRQGGGSYSTLEEQREDALYRSYAAFMGSTMFVFGMFAMGAFVFAHYYVNWEQNKYAYGVFRSMGMSYRTLQRKLLLQYMTGIVFAWLIACCVVKECFGYSFTVGQVLLSGACLLSLVGVCYAILYRAYQSKRICDMLQRG